MSTTTQGTKAATAAELTERRDTEQAELEQARIDLEAALRRLGVANAGRTADADDHRQEVARLRAKIEEGAVTLEALEPMIQEAQRREAEEEATRLEREAEKDERQWSEDVATVRKLLEDFGRTFVPAWERAAAGYHRCKSRRQQIEKLRGADNYAAHHAEPNVRPEPLPDIAVRLAAALGSQTAKARITPSPGALVSPHNPMEEREPQPQGGNSLPAGRD